MAGEIKKFDFDELKAGMQVFVPYRGWRTVNEKVEHLGKQAYNKGKLQRFYFVGTEIFYGDGKCSPYDLKQVIHVMREVSNGK